MARISVRLTPRGGRDGIDGWAGDVLCVRVAAPPIDGRANEAMLRLLAKAAGVAPSKVALASGAQSRVKVVDIDGVNEEELRARL